MEKVSAHWNSTNNFVWLEVVHADDALISLELVVLSVVSHAFEFIQEHLNVILFLLHDLAL